LLVELNYASKILILFQYFDRVNKCISKFQCYIVEEANISKPDIVKNAIDAINCKTKFEDRIIFIS
jgi:hypothetical protein